MGAAGFSAGIRNEQTQAACRTPSIRLSHSRIWFQLANIRLAWQKHAIGKLSYPLCSDFYPHGEVCRRYGLLREGPPVPGISNRAVIIVDKKGRVAWKKVYDLPTPPNNAEILEALKSLT